MIKIPEEEIKCLICGKEPNYCEECHHNTFHNAHISLLQGYMKHEDPLKEIKRILYGEPNLTPLKCEKILTCDRIAKGIVIDCEHCNKFQKTKDKLFMIPTVFGTPEELNKSHEELKKIVEIIPKSKTLKKELMNIIYSKKPKNPYPFSIQTKKDLKPDKEHWKVDLNEVFEGLVGVKIPYWVIIKIDSFKDKYNFKRVDEE